MVRVGGKGGVRMHVRCGGEGFRVKSYTPPPHLRPRHQLSSQARQSISAQHQQQSALSPVRHISHRPQPAQQTAARARPVCGWWEGGVRGTESSTFHTGLPTSTWKHRPGLHEGGVGREGHSVRHLSHMEAHGSTWRHRPGLLVGGGGGTKDS